ncbi:MAG: hypothetical protein M3Q45_11135, partial [Chloroflexota bacterium]|nr:hypothetical protein [Chloroflexota bacterium]
VSTDWTGDGADDLLVIYQNPTTTLPAPQSDLIVLNSSATGFQVGHRARAAGQVRLLTSEDINGDAQPDIAWVDTTCGASTCFDNVEIYSWTGTQWQDWTNATISMAYAEINVDDVSEAGQGNELVLAGGIYGSVGAGPQRGRSEIWGSVEGAPYQLLEQRYDVSNCLYHVVLDANAAFLQGGSDNFATAEALYGGAITDVNLSKCWVREDEIDELKSFSLFRLALVAARQGQPAVAADVIGSLLASYADSIYAGVGQTWLSSYQQSNDLGVACAATNAFAEANPTAWDLLADYGYANPSFTAADVCPLLAGETAALTTGDSITATRLITPAGSITNGRVISQLRTLMAATPVTATRAAPTTTPVSLVTTATMTTPLTTTATQAVVINSGVACPTDLAGYTDAMLTLITAANGDAPTVEQWLRACGALDDQRGAFQMLDLNDDGLQDLVFLPTIVSDRGFGRDGAQGAVLIYHAQNGGGYKLVARPEIYGQPMLLRIDDLNADSKLDLAWTVEGCSPSFCVLETQVVTWDGNDYVSIVQPGAIIAEGKVSFEGVAPGEPGRGQQLVLVGGISGTPEGGLATPHTEIWQSVQGNAFQRIRWTYDRTAEGNDCLGLRLVEADVALQAAPVLGYDAAIKLYTESLDSQLQACSIFGLAANEELVLLQGLASFRLVQAQALSGDVESARTALATLSKGQPASQYTAAAQTWLDEYAKANNPGAACQVVQPIFAQNEDLWKITDHFGYNHPALAAEQICYQP